MSEVKGKNFILTAGHCRSARALIYITQQQLAAASGVNVETIRQFEKQVHVPREATLAKLQEALERRGIEFLNGGSPGVRLRPEQRIID